MTYEKVTEVELQFACELCKAPPGELCRGPSGKVMKFQHASRFDQATDAGLLPLKDEEDDVEE